MSDPWDIINHPKKFAHVLGVRVEEYAGRPRLFLMVQCAGEFATRYLEIDREKARQLSEAWGPNRVVEAFFSEGKGVQ